MDCPQCKGYRLEPKMLEEGLLAASCIKCEGALLPLMNYRYWIDQQPEVVTDTQNTEVAEDNEKAQLCPKCRHLMTKYRIGSNSLNRIDLCSACDEAWLDKGEWQLLKQLDLHEKLPRIFTDAWQRNIRQKRSEALQRKRYIEMLGEADHNRLTDFKVWLDNHSEKQSILRYLFSPSITDKPV